MKRPRLGDWGTGVAIGVAVLLASTGLAALETARRHASALDARAATAGRALPPPAAVDAWRAADRQTAQRLVLSALRRAAAAEGLLLETLGAAPARHAPPLLLDAQITLSGPEARLLRFIAIAESGHPAIRFPSWKLARTSGEAAVRLDARAVAVWQPPS